MPLRPGLVSVSFRRLGVPAVVDLARRAGLRGIEWGGDVHAPHGDLGAARDAGARTLDAGLAVSAYGSYYRLGQAGGPRFEDVLASARALGAPLIRVWAGSRASALVDDAEFERVAADARRAVALAGGAGLGVAMEYHEGTLTDHPVAALRLLGEAPGLRSLWQPPQGRPAAECAAGLRDLVGAGRLAHLHAFHWWPDAATRLPLAQGRDRWRAYLALAAQAPGERYVSLEFVKDDSPRQLLQDAAALGEMLRMVM
jgi:sugar phosphate isomerase/epimerase